MFKEGQPQPENIDDKEMSRRSFIKKAGASALLAMLGASVLGEKGKKEQPAQPPFKQTPESKTEEIKIARKISPPEKEKNPIESAQQRLEQYRQEHLKEQFSPYYLVINANKNQQKLYFFDQEKTIATYPISTAQKGNSLEEKEETTPLGIHKIMGFKGHGLDSGSAIDAYGDKGYNVEIIRNPGEFTAEMTSRILVLEGLEKNNRQTQSRGIFIHGTNLEGNLGKPDSHGCIRMKNDHIIELEKILYQDPSDTLIIIIE